METMKAVICGKYGPPEVLKIGQRPKPVPAEDEVLIRIHAASVTDSDLFIRSGRVSWRMMVPFRLMMGLRKPRRSVLGEVLAGEIEMVGPAVTRFKPGDRVFGLTGFSLGAYAEYKCMKESDSKKGCLALMPKNLNYEEATSAAYGGLLAFQFMEKTDIRPGWKVLVYGASGTSGTIAVQYAKHRGAEVTGVCGPANPAFVRSLGADKTLDYTNEASLNQLDRYDVVVDAVGKRKTSALKKACRRALAKNGKYVSIDDGALLLESDRLARIVELVERGAIKPVTDRVYPLDQIVEAHRYVETGHKRGNVAITVMAETQP